MSCDLGRPDDRRASVIDRFGKVATAPAGESKFPLGPDSAKRLGYDPARVDAMPASVTESFCGVGDPFSLGEPGTGQTVLDLGCGAGFDAMLAALRVGPSGRVIGVDMTPEMIVKARHNADRLGLANVEFVLGDAGHLPMPDASADLIITNGVLNLCPDKPAILAEARRVLRPDGRLQMADILLHDEVTPDEVAGKGEWSD